MSQYHVLKKAIDNKTCAVAEHLPILAGENTAGQNLPDSITYRDAVLATLAKNELGNVVYTVVPGLDTGAGSAHEGLETGALKEHLISFRFSTTSLTNAQRRTEIETHVSQNVSDIAVPGSALWNQILEPLEWWGYHRDIP